MQLNWKECIFLLKKFGFLSEKICSYSGKLNDFCHFHYILQFSLLSSSHWIIFFDFFFLSFRYPLFIQSKALNILTTNHIQSPWIVPASMSTIANTESILNHNSVMVSTQLSSSTIRIWALNLHFQVTNQLQQQRPWSLLASGQTKHIFVKFEEKNVVLLTY